MRAKPRQCPSRGSLLALSLLLAITSCNADLQSVGKQTARSVVANHFRSIHTFVGAQRNLKQYQEDEDYEEPLGDDEEVYDYEEALEEELAKEEKAAYYGGEETGLFSSATANSSKTAATGLGNNKTANANATTSQLLDEDSLIDSDAYDSLLELKEENPEVTFDSETEKEFENEIIAEAHQKALELGTNPARLAAGARNSTSRNETKTASGMPILKDPAGTSLLTGEEADLTPNELEEMELLEAELEEEEAEEYEDEDSSALTLPIDESVQRGLDAHIMDPMPSKNSDSANKSVANAHEKNTLDTLQDLQGVVDEDELEDSLALEKEVESERLSDLDSDLESSSLTVDKSAIRARGGESSAKEAGQAKNSTVFTQSLVMGGAFKDAVAKHSSTTLRVVGVIIAALAGIGFAWGSIVLYNRCRPAQQGSSLPKVIEISSFTRKPQTYSRVKGKPDEGQGDPQWHDWDDDWDDHAASSARRGNSVKLKRPQKWDEDW